MTRRVGRAEERAAEIRLRRQAAWLARKTGNTAEGALQSLRAAQRRLRRIQAEVGVAIIDGEINLEPILRRLVAEEGLEPQELLRMAEEIVQELGL